MTDEIDRWTRRMEYRRRTFLAIKYAYRLAATAILFAAVITAAMMVGAWYIGLEWNPIQWPPGMRLGHLFIMSYVGLMGVLSADANYPK